MSDQTDHLDINHHGHDHHWTMRSLIAVALLAACAVATTLSASDAAKQAEAARLAEMAIAEEAELAADLMVYLKQETAATREALEAPSLKPARETHAILTSGNVLASIEDFDFAVLNNARDDGRERKCLSQAIYYEARSERRVGQLAVADVVLNRVASRVYPNTICGVVFQGSHRRTGCQFSFTCDGSMNAKLHKRRWEASEELAAAVLAGIRVPVSRNATHYHANYVDPYWSSSLTPTATIGTHKFYKFRSNRNKASAPAAM